MNDCFSESTLDVHGVALDHVNACKTNAHVYISHFGRGFHSSIPFHYSIPVVQSSEYRHPTQTLDMPVYGLHLLMSHMSNSGILHHGYLFLRYMHGAYFLLYIFTIYADINIQTRVLRNTYHVRTKHCQYRLYYSDIVAYACVIVETHGHCQYTPSNTTNWCTHGYCNNLVATLPGPLRPRDRAALIERLRSGTWSMVH